MVSRTRRIAVASLFGVTIFLFRGFIPAPTADYLIGIESFLLGLGFVILRRGGATYIEAVNGLLTTLVKPYLAPFSLVFALLFGGLVDVISSVLKVRVGNEVRRGRMIFSLALSTAITGPIAYYTTVFATRLLPNNPSIALTILVFGVISGGLGGYLAAVVWNKNLKARFQA